MGDIVEFVYGEGSGRRLQTKKVTMATGDSGTKTVSFDGDVLSFQVENITDQATNPAHANNVAKTSAKIGANPNEIDLTLVSMDPTATTPTWSATGASQSNGQTYRIIALVD